MKCDKSKKQQTDICQLKVIILLSIVGFTASAKTGIDHFSFFFTSGKKIMFFSF